MSDRNDILSKGWNKNRRIGMNFVTFAMVFAMVLVTLGGLGCIGGSDSGADANTNADSSTSSETGEGQSNSLFANDPRIIDIPKVLPTETIGRIGTLYKIDTISEVISISEEPSHMNTQLRITHLEVLDGSNIIIKFIIENDHKYSFRLTGFQTRVYDFNGGFRSIVEINKEPRMIGSI